MTDQTENDLAYRKPGLLAKSSFLRSKALRKVIAALTSQGGDVRIVGGTVRNALLGHPVSDIDIATPVLPEDVMQLARAANLGVHPTGIEHGTVTVVADETPFEVTTLRRDVETDGRRAVVAFSSDWREDAGRRDFTINALYAAPNGDLFDYFEGLDDLEAGCVRFIGDAHDRIGEDYLRILRFFRFTALYGRGAPEGTGLAACVAQKEGMAQLSAERVGTELIKLMSAPRAGEIIQVMSEAGVLEIILGSSTFPDRLLRLVAIESEMNDAPDPLTRLAALALAEPECAARLARLLRLSSIAEKSLAEAATPNTCFDPATPEKSARACLYSRGSTNYRRAALLAWAASNDAPNDALRRVRAKLPERWSPPVLPVRGADVLALGIPKGPMLGKILEAFEAWWIGEDFPNDPALHKEMLASIIANYC